MPKVSIIIPAYNVEKYLPECLESVDKQTFRDFELILVDDGSPDSCGKLCDEFAAKHPYARVLHQENMGLSEARNQGVKISTGEYITFIDSDDCVTPDYLEHLLSLIEKHEVDVSIACPILFWDDEIPSVSENNITEQKLSSSKALEQICYNRIPICAWGKLYKRHLVEKYPYPKGELYEDTATTHKIVGAVPAIAYSTHKIYYWRQRSGSITHSAITERHYYGITASMDQLNYMIEHYPEVVPAAQVRYMMKVIDLSYRLMIGKKDQALFARIRAAGKPLVFPVLKNKKASVSLKVRSFALWLGFLPYLFVSKMYFVVKKNAKGTE